MLMGLLPLEGGVTTSTTTRFLHLLLLMSFLSSPVATTSSLLLPTATILTSSSLSSSVFSSSIPTTTFQTAAAATTTTTVLQASKNNNKDDENNNNSIVNAKKVKQLWWPRGGGEGEGDNNNKNTKGQEMKMIKLSPRATSCIYMACAMALHFGGYEFARSGALALFTSSTTGYTHPAAYPFAIGLVTPTSLLLLYWYGILLKAKGPRIALRTTKTWSISILTISSLLLVTLQNLTTSTSVSVLLDVSKKFIVGSLFVFQNSYAHLLYSQQWSFLGSVMTPNEGTKYFSAIAGLSSVICTITASLVHLLAIRIGLLGLVGGTCLTLSISLWCADHAYELSERNGFDPAETMREHQSKKEEQKTTTGKSTTSDESTTSSISKPSSSSSSSSLLSKTILLFQTVPTLAALFGEVISFQSLSTVLNVCFVRQLKESLPLDTDRASFTGQLYSYVNGMAGLTQFLLLPLLRKYLEPKWVYKFMPCLLLPLLGYLNWVIVTGGSSGGGVVPSLLWLTAASFFCLKTLDYSLRNVVNEMVFQPLDFDSRYLGKEVIGVFANRFGKSGMSLLLSLATATFGASVIGISQLSQCSLVVGGAWTACSWWLSQYLPTNQEAEQKVQERNQQNRRGIGGRNDNKQE